jgi:L-iditol 2-dehydrogenase
MKALRKMKRGKGAVELVSVPAPSPGKGEVQVRVQCAGICGTDIHILHDLYGNLRPPVTLGHEFAGVVAAVGEDVADWKTGERVTVESLAAFCGRCRYCQAGETQCCPKRQAYGISRDGAFADYVVARQGALHRLPEGVSFRQGAMAEPLCVAVHAVMEKSAVKPGDTALVTGPGTIGQLVAQVARLLGASVIMAGTSKDGERLELAWATGAEHCIYSDREELSAAVDRITDGGGVDVAFECAGAKAAIRDCLQAVRKGGEVVQVGLAGGSLELDYDAICLKEITLKGSFTHNHQTWRKSVALLNDPRLKLEALVSGEFPLEQWRTAFDQCGQAHGLKYLLNPSLG